MPIQPASAVHEQPHKQEPSPELKERVVSADSVALSADMLFLDAHPVGSSFVFPDGVDHAGKTAVVVQPQMVYTTTGYEASGRGKRTGIQTLCVTIEGESGWFFVDARYHIVDHQQQIVVE